MIRRLSVGVGFFDLRLSFIAGEELLGHAAAYTRSVRGLREWDGETQEFATKVGGARVRIFNGSLVEP